MTWHSQSPVLGLIYLLWFGCGPDDREVERLTGPSASQITQQDSTTPFLPSTLTLTKTTTLDPGDIWCVPNYDGKTLVVR